LLLKLGSNLMVLPYLGKHTGNELGSDSCSPTIGGLTPSGDNAVNELTYLWLEAYENVKATGNSFMVRLSGKNPPAYWQRVFDTQQIAMEKLVAMLDTNFAGEEAWQQRLKHRGPVYGADQPEADGIAADLVAYFCDEVARHQTIRGGPFRPSFFSYGMHVFEGMLLGATPNGRKAGEPISNSFSPSNGSERNGPTALFRSVAAIDHRRISNGCALNVKFLPSLFIGDERRDRMVALVRTFFEQGGMEVQPNVVSSATLRAAQRSPDQYRDLVVRVSGYSAYFCDLGTALQNEIISRSELGE
jgi:formate C-acetyltransferase